MRDRFACEHRGRVAIKNRGEDRFAVELALGLEAAPFGRGKRHLESGLRQHAGLTGLQAHFVGPAAVEQGGHSCNIHSLHANGPTLRPWIIREQRR